MTKWLGLLAVAVTCALAGLGVGRLLAPAPVPLSTPTPVPPPLAQPLTTPGRELKLLVVLVNDLGLAPRSHVEMVWAGDIVWDAGPVSVALTPLPNKQWARVGNLPWLQPNGHLNPKVLQRLWQTQDFHYLVLDVPGFMRLLKYVGGVPDAQGQRCTPQECILRLYGASAGADRTALYQQIAQRILAWMAAAPEPNARLVEEWMVLELAQGTIKSDVPLEIWTEVLQRALAHGLWAVH